MPTGTSIVSAIATAIDVSQGPPADAVVMETAEHVLELPAAFLRDVPQQGATRTSVTVGLGVGLVLCLIGLAALDGGPSSPIR